MNCLVCRGACCESFSAEIQMIPANKDSQRWLELHATKITFRHDIQEPELIPRLTFECRCTKLTSDGLCSIWDVRPMVCELFIAGSRECLEAVKTRRTKEQYQLIRNESDPPTIHEFPFAREWVFENGKYVKIYDKEEEMKMALTRAEGIRLIDDLIKKFDDQDLDLRCELLTEMVDRADTAKSAAEEEAEQDEEVDDADEDQEDDELAEDD